MAWRPQRLARGLACGATAAHRVDVVPTGEVGGPLPAERPGSGAAPLPPGHPAAALRRFGAGALPPPALP